MGGTKSSSLLYWASGSGSIVLNNHIREGTINIEEIDVKDLIITESQGWSHPSPLEIIITSKIEKIESLKLSRKLLLNKINTGENYFEIAARARVFRKFLKYAALEDIAQVKDKIKTDEDFLDTLTFVLGQKATKIGNLDAANFKKIVEFLEMASENLVIRKDANYCKEKIKEAIETHNLKKEKAINM